jgi:hypothetical protein
MLRRDHDGWHEPQTLLSDVTDQFRSPFEAFLVADDGCIVATYPRSGGRMIFRCRPAITSTCKKAQPLLWPDWSPKLTAGPNGMVSVGRGLGGHQVRDPRIQVRELPGWG